MVQGLISSLVGTPSITLGRPSDGLASIGFVSAGVGSGPGAASAVFAFSVPADGVGSAFGVVFVVTGGGGMLMITGGNRPLVLSINLLDAVFSFATVVAAGSGEGDGVCFGSSGVGVASGVGDAVGNAFGSSAITFGVSSGVGDAAASRVGLGEASTATGVGVSIGVGLGDGSGVGVAITSSGVGTGVGTGVAIGVGLGVGVDLTIAIGIAGVGVGRTATVSVETVGEGFGPIRFSSPIVWPFTRL